MTNPPSPSRRWRWLGRWLLALALAACAWAGWRAVDERAAIREAQAAGWGCEKRDPFSLILADWRAAGQKETWTVRYRYVRLSAGTSLAAARPLLLRLRPMILFAVRCPDPDLDALRGLPALQVLGLIHCTGLQNVDALRGLSTLQELDLTGCTGLRNVDALRGLSALQGLDLADCTALPASALRELRTALPQTTIIFPDGTTSPPP